MGNQADSAATRSQSKSEPAFPFPLPSGTVEPGLTKREWFIGMALMGLCANSIPGRHHHANEHAKEAISNADAVLDLLAKEQQP